MLHGSDASELSLADTQHDLAEEKQADVAEYVAQGDYDSARDAAEDAVTYQHWADGNAGGEDHTAQAQHMESENEWADWNQEIAEDNQQSAEAYAATGDMDNAAMYQQVADDHQQVADDYGASSINDAPYDTADTTYDASYSAVDTTATDTSYSSTDTSSTSTDYSSYDTE
jgi:hypothetical protein